MADKAQTSEQPLELPGMYFNGFQLGITNADVSGLMLLNGQPQLVMNLSYTTAKTLHESLGTLIGELEKATERTIMTTHQIDEGMARAGKTKVEP